MITTSPVDLKASSIHIPACDNASLDAEDFFIDGLSEFSNEDIAAPVNWNARGCAFPDYSALMHPMHPHPHSDDNAVASCCISKNPSSCIKSNCTTANTSTDSGSVLLHDSPSALDYQSPLGFEMDSSLSLPCQDESPGFEWLTSLEDDHSILGAASSLGMDSFLLSSSTEPFTGAYNGFVKHSDYNNEDDSKAKDNTVFHNMEDDAVFTNGSRDHRTFQWGDQDCGMKLEYDAITSFMPHSTGSRSKRARSAGWSSSNYIFSDSWETGASSTNSLNSTAQILPNPHDQYGNAPHDAQPPSIGHNRGENGDLVSPSLGAGPRREKPFHKASPTGGGWAREDDDNNTNMTREERASSHGELQPRRCTHCLSQKTPQWRAGPEGPKTLCNACGVRYKSGRLFDEYRPAKSPTFLSYKHSNSHKKVMEMRRRKTFQYIVNSNHQHHQPVGSHHARTAGPGPSSKHQEVMNPHALPSKLSVSLHPSSLEPHSHFSDITLISTTRTALEESPASFLY